MNIPRLVSPLTNPNGYIAAAGAVLAAVIMISNAAQGHGVINVTVIVSAAGAVGALIARHVVTPVSDPKSASGTPLVPAPGPASPAVTGPDPVIPGPVAAGGATPPYPVTQVTPYPPGDATGKKEP